jgi:hypothetical protein
MKLKKDVGLNKYLGSTKRERNKERCTTSALILASITVVGAYLAA